MFFPGDDEQEYYEYERNSDGEPPWGLDPFSGETPEVTVDLEDFKSSVWQRIYQHYVCALGSSAVPGSALLTEAELHMLSYDYRQALICALAAGSVDESDGVQLRRAMIQTICMYQLGDRSAACLLKEEIGEEYDEEMLSSYLAKRYRGTCEVLTFMPDLMGMLQGLAKSDDNQY